MSPNNAAGMWDEPGLVFGKGGGGGGGGGGVQLRGSHCGNVGMIGGTGMRDKDGLAVVFRSPNDQPVQDQQAAAINRK